MLGMLRPRIRRAFRLAIRRESWNRLDIDEELRFHLEQRVEQLVASGWSCDDAAAEARRRFGSSWDAAVENLHRSGRAREERLAMREHLESIWNDARYTVRVLRRAPRFTAAAVLTLALGLGTTTVIFSLVDHIVLRPLSYAHPERLVVVREIVGDLRDVYPTMPANASHFLAWRRACTICEGVAAIKRHSVTLTTGGDPQRVGAVRMSANLFDVLGVRPALGRAFRTEEETTGKDHVVILSHAFWQRQFGGDSSIVGRVITLNDAPFEVVGIMPAGFTIPTGEGLGALVGLPRTLELYRPLAFTTSEAASSGEFDYAVIARLRSTATASQLRAQLDAVQSQWAIRSGSQSTLQTSVVPLHEQVVGSANRPLLLLLAAVGAVLLIVCVNLTSLSLARHAARQHKSAIRVALGAGRAQLARLALAESLVVAIAGGLLGLLLARWGLGALVALAPSSLPRAAEIRLDARVFAVAVLLTAGVGVLVGALPAIRAGRTDPGDALKAGGRRSTGGRSAAHRRALFIGAQVAFSTLLLVAAGLFLSSFVRVMRVDRGFETDHVLALDVALPPAAYASQERLGQFYERALSELSATPGVMSAAATSALPLEGETWVNGVGRADGMSSTDDRPSANYRFVSPDYFTTLGTPLSAGHAFTASDRGRQVVVVSEHVARALWPHEDAIGKRAAAGNFGTVEVVGIAADVRTSTLEQEGSLVIYLPLWQNLPSQGTLVVRTSGAPAAMAGVIRTALRRVDPAVPVPRVRTMADVVSATVAARRFELGLLALFALMALVTASVGIYGVISQSLASRTREIGVRMALGARPLDVHRLVLGEGLTPVAGGLVVGVGASMLAGRAIESLLFGVRAGDPTTIAAVCALLGLVALVACLIPSRRAASTQLSLMLRAD